eukprot:5579595-Amphidinium_carterae.1
MPVLWWGGVTPLRLGRRRSLNWRLHRYSSGCAGVSCRGMRLRTGIMHWTSAVPRHVCLTSSGHGVCAMHQVMSLSELAVLFQMRLPIHVMLREETI